MYHWYSTLHTSPNDEIRWCSIRKGSVADGVCIHAMSPYVRALDWQNSARIPLVYLHIFTVGTLEHHHATILSKPFPASLLEPPNHEVIGHIQRKHPRIWNRNPCVLSLRIQMPGLFYILRLPRPYNTIVDLRPFTCFWQCSRPWLRGHPAATSFPWHCGPYLHHWLAVRQY